MFLSADFSPLSAQWWKSSCSPSALALSVLAISKLSPIPASHLDWIAKQQWESKILLPSVVLTNLQSLNWHLQSLSAAEPKPYSMPISLSRLLLSKSIRKCVSQSAIWSAELQVADMTHILKLTIYAFARNQACGMGSKWCLLAL